MYRGCNGVGGGEEVMITTISTGDHLSVRRPSSKSFTRQKLIFDEN